MQLGRDFRAVETSLDRLKVGAVFSQPRQVLFLTTKNGDPRDMGSLGFSGEFGLFHFTTLYPSIVIK